MLKSRRVIDKLTGPDHFVFDTAGATRTAVNHTQGRTNRRVTNTESIGATMGNGFVQHFDCVVPFAKYNKNDNYEFTNHLKDCSYSSNNLFNLFMVNYDVERRWEA